MKVNEMRRLLAFLLAVAMFTAITVPAAAVTPDTSAKSLVCLDREYNFLSKANYVALSGSADYTAMIRDDGSLWMFGSNSDGQLGIGSARHSYNAPIKVLEDVARVKTVENTTLAIKKDGTVWGFGQSYGDTPSQIFSQKVKDAAFSGTLFSFVDQNGNAWIRNQKNGQSYRITENAEELYLCANSMATYGFVPPDEQPEINFDNYRDIVMTLPDHFLLVRRSDNSVVQYSIKIGSNSVSSTGRLVAENVEKLSVYNDQYATYLAMQQKDGTIVYGNSGDGIQTVSLPEAKDVLCSGSKLLYRKADDSLWIYGQDRCIGKNVKLYTCVDTSGIFMIHHDNTVSVNGFSEEVADDIQEKFNAVNNLGIYRSTTPMHEDIYAKTMEIVGDETDPYLQADLICSWIAQNIRYQKGDTDQNCVQAFRTGIGEHAASFAHLTRIMLSYVGIPVTVVAGSTLSTYHGHPITLASHTWNLALIDGVTVFIDTTAGSSGFDYPMFKKGSFSFDAYQKSVCAKWAVTEVRAAYDHDLIDFSVSDAYGAITRDRFCTLVRAMIEKVEGRSIDAILTSLGRADIPVGFTDTESADVFALYRMGIIDGTSATTFEPDRSITRQEAAKILRSLAITLGEDVSAPRPTFADTAEIAAWALDGVSFAAHNGIMQGDGTNFNPLDSITTQESILICYRYYESLAN